MKLLQGEILKTSDSTEKISLSNLKISGIDSKNNTNIRSLTVGSECFLFIPTNGHYSEYTNEYLNGGVTNHSSYYDFKVAKLTTLYKDKPDRLFNRVLFRTSTLHGCCGILNLHTSVANFFSLCTVEEQLALISTFFNKYTAVIIAGTVGQFPCDFFDGKEPKDFLSYQGCNPKGRDIYNLMLTRKNYKKILTTNKSGKIIEEDYDLLEEFEEMVND